MKNLFLGAVLLTTAGIASAQDTDIAIGNINLADGTFVISCESGATITDFTLWISAPDWEDAPVILNDEEVLPFTDTHTFTGVSVQEGLTLQLPLPISWLNWMSHGMFSDQDNACVIGVWSINSCIPWIYEGNDYPLTDFADDYSFVMCNVTENLLEVAGTVEYIYVGETSGIEVASVQLLTVLYTGDALSFVTSGNIESFAFSLYNSTGQLVYETTDINEEWYPSNPTGVYIYSLTSVINGEPNVSTDNLYIQN